LKTYTVFYASLLYGEYAIGEWPGAHSLPDGCYMLMSMQRSRDWYVKQHGSLTPIELSDVPLELRTLLLLLT